MKVRCKFYCNSKTEFVGQTKISLNAACDSKGENAAFTDQTPSGNLEINVKKDAPAIDFFQVGEFYYLDFTQAPKS